MELVFIFSFGPIDQITTSTLRFLFEQRLFSSLSRAVINEWLMFIRPPPVLSRDSQTGWSFHS